MGFLYVAVCLILYLASGKDGMFFPGIVVLGIAYLLIKLSEISEKLTKLIEKK